MRLSANHKDVLFHPVRSIFMYVSWERSWLAHIFLNKIEKLSKTTDVRNPKEHIELNIFAAECVERYQKSIQSKFLGVKLTGLNGVKM